MFFKGHRRKVELVNYTPKQNAENEKRIRLDFAMPLSGQPLTGLPEFLNEAFEALQNVDNGANEAYFTHEIEGVTLEFFDTDKSRNRTQLVTAATIVGVYLKRPKTGDEAEDVTLYFNTTVKGDSGLAQWAWTYFGATLWCQFEVTEPKLQMDAAKKDEGHPQLPLENRKAIEDATAADFKRKKGGPDGKSAAGGAAN